MKNALEIVKDLGIELTEEQQATLNSEISANYKTSAEFDKKIKKLQEEKDNLQAQFDSANKTLKDFEGVNVDEIKSKLADYEHKVQDLANDYQKKIEERDFNDVLKASLENVKFSSESAKRAIMEDISKAGLKLMNGKILGLTEYLEEIKRTDASAFVEDKERARFTAPKDTKTGNPKLTKKDILAITDTRERQKAIEENIELFINNKE